MLLVIFLLGFILMLVCGFAFIDGKAVMVIPFTIGLVTVVLSPLWFLAVLVKFKVIILLIGVLAVLLSIFLVPHLKEIDRF